MRRASLLSLLAFMTAAGFAAAASNATWDATQGFAQALVNEPGATAWPITSSPNATPIKPVSGS